MVLVDVGSRLILEVCNLLVGALLWRIHGFRVCVFLVLKIQDESNSKEFFETASSVGQVKEPSVDDQNNFGRRWIEKEMHQVFRF